MNRSAGRNFFVVNHEGTVYKKHLTEHTSGIDVFPDAESLKREWSRLD